MGYRLFTLLCNVISPRSRPLPHYASKIWKRRSRSEDPTSVLRPYHAGEIWKQNNHWLLNCLSAPLKDRADHVIIVTSSFFLQTASFWKAPFSNVFRPHTKTQSWWFQIPLVWIAFSKSSVFGVQFIQISLDQGRPIANRRNKAAFSDFPGPWVWMGPRTNFKNIALFD